MLPSSSGRPQWGLPQPSLLQEECYPWASLSLGSPSLPVPKTGPPLGLQNTSVKQRPLAPPAPVPAGRTHCGPAPLEGRARRGRRRGTRGGYCRGRVPGVWACCAGRRASSAGPGEVRAEVRDGKRGTESAAGSGGAAARGAPRAACSWVTARRQPPLAPPGREPLLSARLLRFSSRLSVGRPPARRCHGAAHAGVQRLVLGQPRFQGASEVSRDRTGENQQVHQRADQGRQSPHRGPAEWVGRRGRGRAGQELLLFEWAPGAGSPAGRRGKKTSRQLSAPRSLSSPHPGRVGGGGGRGAAAEGSAAPCAEGRAALGAGLAVRVPSFSLRVKASLPQLLIRRISP